MGGAEQMGGPPHPNETMSVSKVLVSMSAGLSVKLFSSYLESQREDEVELASVYMQVGQSIYKFFTSL